MGQQSYDLGDSDCIPFSTDMELMVSFNCDCNLFYKVIVPKNSDRSGNTHMKHFHGLGSKT